MMSQTDYGYQFSLEIIAFLRYNGDVHSKNLGRRSKYEIVRCVENAQCSCHSIIMI
jgi:hypothetical protein